MIIGIDPGPAKSGWVLLDDKRLHACGVDDNHTVADNLRRHQKWFPAIEMIASYGMAVGKETFDTCVWIGRFIEQCFEPDEVRLIFRKDIKIHICDNAHAKDANVRQALIDMFPPTGGGSIKQIGTKKEPGPLYGMNTHAWAALGVAVTARDTK